MNNSIESILRGGQFKKLIEISILKIRNKTKLKRVELEIIYFLGCTGEENTMKDICNYLQMNKGHISTALDSLNKQGYVIQQQDSNDRRYTHYTLTDKADDIVKQMKDAWEKLTERLMTGLTKEDIEIFEAVSAKLGKNIEQILEEEKRN